MHPQRTRTVASLAVAAWLFSSSISAGTITFDSGFNFREVRGGQPANFTAGDRLSVGITVVDSDTGLAPAGAIVKVRNSATGEVFVLDPDTPTSYFRSIPYSAARASGDWIVEVQSSVGGATGTLARFGTGAGTGPIPLVDGLSASGTGSNRTLTWSTPSSVVNRSANDGNIDRLRARLSDANGRLIDERGLGVGNAASLNATSYDLDPTKITHNGAYVGQILVEGFTPFSRSRAYEAFVVDDLAGLGGTPVGFDDVFTFRDVRQDNSVQFRGGDFMVLGVDVDLHDDTWVHAQRNGDIVPISQSREANRAFEFATSIDFDGSSADPWTFVAFNGSERTETTSRPFSAPDALPFVRNLALEADDLTPTLRWTLPAGNTVPFDRIQIGLFDDVTDDRLSVFGANGNQLFENLNASDSSFTFKPGQLEFGKAYVARVNLVDDDANGEIVNRSLSFLNFTPVPGTSQGPIFLPTVDANGVFRFDFDVEEAVPIRLDPFVAVGYDYAAETGNPLFSTVALPSVGDDEFDLWLFDVNGVAFDSGIDLLADVEFDLTSLGLLAGVDYSNGAQRFRVLGIETTAGLDPADVTAFVTTLTFASTGTFTGSMTPITQFVPAPSPGPLGLLTASLLAIGATRRQRKS